MKERAGDNPKIFLRMAALLFILGLSLANSALFYFVIWDMLSPSKPYSVILFFVSGGAHLIYFFLPWFFAEMLGPVMRPSSDDARRYDASSQGEGGFFLTACTQFGVVLCVSAIGLWFLQSDLLSGEQPRLALITEANCTEIGGTPKQVDDKIICVITKSDIKGTVFRPTFRTGKRI